MRELYTVHLTEMDYLTPCTKYKYHLSVLIRALRKKKEGHFSFRFIPEAMDLTNVLQREMNFHKKRSWFPFPFAKIGS